MLHGMIPNVDYCPVAVKILETGGVFPPVEHVRECGYCLLMRRMVVAKLKGWSPDTSNVRLIFDQMAQQWFLLDLSEDPKAQGFVARLAQDAQLRKEFLVAVIMAHTNLDNVPPPPENPAWKSVSAPSMPALEAWMKENQT